MQIIGVGAAKFLGAQRIFAQISPNLPERTPKTDLKKNDCISFHVESIFSNQGTSSTIFAQMSPKLAQNSPNLPKTHDLQ